MIASVPSERCLKIWLILIYFVPAALFLEYPKLSLLVRRFFSDKNDKNLCTALPARLARFGNSCGCEAVFLPDTRFTKRLILSGDTERTFSYVLPSTSEQPRLGKIVFKDFYGNDLHREIHRKNLAPVLDMAFRSAAFAIENAGASGDCGALPTLMLELERQYALLESTIPEVLA
jgi:hypothetical protein